MENKDLKYIKKHYGENFAHLCRTLFPSVLEVEGLLPSLITRTFAPTKSLYEDLKSTPNAIDDFKSYISNLANEVIKPVHEKSPFTPEELLDRAGYILYPECTTEDEIQAFKKYYEKGEELCTFRGGRLNTCRVWFAVKKNVDEIKRENFLKPLRQDEYGTSVISIQFTKAIPNTLSIKNRYNHVVLNPDATFSNDLDNIIAGLTDAFVEKYSLLTDLSRMFIAPSCYVLANDGVYYRYNIVADETYYCENNIAIIYGRDFGRIFHVDKSRYILMENYIVDLQGKKVFQFHEFEKKDSFIKSLGNIKDINLVKKEDGNKVIVITSEGKDENIEITLGRRNQIIGLKNNCVREVGSYFLRDNIELENLEMNNLEICGEAFLFYNKGLKELNLPNLDYAGSHFIAMNEAIEKINLSKLDTIRNSFLSSNLALREVALDKVTSIGSYFLMRNEQLRKLSLKNVKRIGFSFMMKNTCLEEIDVSSCERIENSFLENNNSLKKIELDNLVEVSSGFMPNNEVLEEITVGKLKKCFLNNFLTKNINLNVLALKISIKKNRKIKKNCPYIFNKNERV